MAARRPDVAMSLVSREVVDTTGTVLRELKSRVEQVGGTAGLVHAPAHPDMHKPTHPQTQTPADPDTHIP
jgi:hypothetical protein